MPSGPVWIVTRVDPQHLLSKFPHLLLGGRHTTGDAFGDNGDATQIRMLLETPAAPAPGVDLRLDHYNRIAGRFNQRFDGGDRTGNVGDGISEWNGDAASFHQLLGLVLMDLQRTDLLIAGAFRPESVPRQSPALSCDLEDEPSVVPKVVVDPGRNRREWRARGEDLGEAGFFEFHDVVVGDDAAPKHHDVAGATFLEQFDHSRE